MATNFHVNNADLAKILEQIKIAEQHAATGVLANLDGTPVSALLPTGLRTVDGSDNSLLPGQSNFGAADQVMPRLLTPEFRDDADGDLMPLGPPGSGAPTISNTDYDTHQSVADADPRIISNLIADQTLSNFSAVVEALELAGSADPLADAAAIQAEPEATRLALAQAMGLDISANGSVSIDNLSPDIGLSPSFNSWMTLFGQFFDHGLDLIPKSGNGTVYMPLQPDDPLYDPTPGAPNFMAMTRAATVTTAGADGVLGTADDQTHETINTTTPYVDQNQTYTSHPSHQVFLREYALQDGKPVATGYLLEGAGGGIANWTEVKAQARDLLGIQLDDFDIGNVPLLRTDAYGKFIAAANGCAQVIIGVGADGIANTADDEVAVGTPAAPVSPAAVNALRTGHAFLDDIAHHAAPGYYDHDHNPATPKIQQTADSDTDSTADDHDPATYDDELLGRHYITGDGRGNENIGLTAVHTVFHAEHNRLVDEYKQTILQSGNLAYINEWLLTELPALDQVPTTLAGIEALSWDGERLFQAGRFVTEMEYQHMVFEEFARKVQPAVDPFGGTATDIDPAIVAEFAHVVYRFGHSMLKETVDRLDIANNVVGGEHIGLIEAFLNPVEFDQDGTLTPAAAAGQIIRGMTRQVGNEIDEFVTEALRNNLVGLPLDLAAINMARGRDTGVPTLNHARAQFFEMTGDSRLTPYTSWTDFATHIKNPFSVVNFIAAYGSHDSIAAAATLEAKRDAALLLVAGGTGAPADSVDFLNATGAYAGGSLGGLNAVDFWIGGLAEEKQQFGGMLGGTFNFVFETQMERLQDGDRFYYLSRLQGMNLVNQIETNSFTDLVMRNTDLGQPGQGHLPGDLFSTPDHILEIDPAVQIGADPSHGNLVLDILTPLFIRRDLDGDGDSDLLQFNGGEHVVLGGSAEDDILIGGLGIDTLWGDGGNDRLDGGYEADVVHGGDGDDIISNLGGDDLLFGDAGNDVISLGAGLVLAFGGDGDDFLLAGPDAGQMFGGTGNDFMLGGSGGDLLMGNEGDDWLEGGQGADALVGDNNERFFDSPIIGHDVLDGQGNDSVYDGESGDDIMVLGAGIQRCNGMFGFDWAIHKGDIAPADSDLGLAFIPGVGELILVDRFDSVEGLSGWNLDDTLTGSANLLLDIRPGTPLDQNHLKAGNVGLIDGLAELLGYSAAQIAAMDPGATVVAADFSRGTAAGGAEIIIGGGGSDRIKGNLGNDILDGDAWLNVRIRVLHNVGDANTPANEWFSVDSLNEIKARLLSGEINPGQLGIVREILQSETAATDVDTAVYNGKRADYSIAQNADGSITVTHNGLVAAFDDHGVDTNRLVSDGVDTIRNFELLEFADGVVDLRTTAASAEVHIAGHTLAADNATADLAASSSLADPGLAAYQWQSLQGGNWVDIAGATAATLLAQSGATLRVAYVDAFGARTLSTETAVVGSGVDDPLAATAGNDLVLGLGGNDTYDLSHTAAGADVNLATGAAASAQTGSDTLVGIENVSGSRAADTITDAVGSNVLNGNGGNDRFVLVGDDARDIIRGGGGENTADYSAATASLAVTLGGTVVVAGSGSTAANCDVLNNIRDFIGGSGDDAITGSNGANELHGGAGNDILAGGRGRDVLSGGEGADVFVYQRAVPGATTLGDSGVGEANRDLIRDFLSGTDKLDFSAIDANVHAAGNQAFSAIQFGTGFTGPGQLRYHHEGSGDAALTVIEGNVGFTLAADFEVALIGHHTFQASDIAL